MILDFLSENLIPDPLVALLIPIPRLVIPDPGPVIPDPTPFFAFDPWSHVPRYDPVLKFGYTLEICLPASCSAPISEWIWKNVPPPPPQIQAWSQAHCGALNLRGLTVKESSVSLPRVRATLWGIALCCVSNVPGWGGERVWPFNSARFAVFLRLKWFVVDIAHWAAWPSQRICWSWHIV